MTALAGIGAVTLALVGCGSGSITQTQTGGGAWQADSEYVDPEYSDPEFSDPEPATAEYAQVCAREVDGQVERVDDDECEDDHRAGSGAFLYFLLMNRGGVTRVPAVGSAVSGGRRSLPQGARAQSGIDPGGASVTKGFSGSHRGSGG